MIVVLLTDICHLPPTRDSLFSFITKSVDYCSSGVACFGPSAAAAEIEASKVFAKDFMDRHGIPTAKWKSFIDHKEAADYINK